MRTFKTFITENWVCDAWAETIRKALTGSELFQDNTVTPYIVQWLEHRGYGWEPPIKIKSISVSCVIHPDEDVDYPWCYVVVDLEFTGVKTLGKHKKFTARLSMPRFSVIVLPRSLLLNKADLAIKIRNMYSWMSDKPTIEIQDADI